MLLLTICEIYAQMARTTITLSIKWYLSKHDSRHTSYAFSFYLCFISTYFSALIFVTISNVSFISVLSPRSHRTVHVQYDKHFIEVDSDDNLV